MTEIVSERSGNGFVFAATGKAYNTLAHRAARSLRLIHPDSEIDLFSDIGSDDEVFSQVHQLSSDWFRPKMEAMLKSRFERSIVLDADIMVVADLTPVFQVLDRFDLAACHNRMMNGEPAQRLHSKALPDSFCSINSGFVGLRATQPVLDFVEAWQKAVMESGSNRDQPAFRELLYESDLRLWILPPGYNLLTFLELETWSGMYSAPRVLHSPTLHKGECGDPRQPFTIEEVIGARHAAQVRALLADDIMLNPGDITKRGIPAPMEKSLYRRLRGAARRVLKGPA